MHMGAGPVRCRRVQNVERHLCRPHPRAERVCVRGSQNVTRPISRFPIPASRFPLPAPTQTTRSIIPSRRQNLHSGETQARPYKNVIPGVSGGAGNAALLTKNMRCSLS